ncbi:MAG: 8-amino-7-oxononanoate synthase [Gammaproteobacteria bacterium]|nr:8-amino-7-oxononanoate synthase [Gammaproteobacteria bacterium]
MDLSARLAEQQAGGLTRQHRLVEGPQQRRLQVKGRELINFSSNDYLGLANDPAVRQAFIEGADQYGVGAGAAHLITGHTRAHHELEGALAEFTGRDRALLFSTGYMANLGVLSALTDRHDVVYQDRLNHASLIDAGLLSRADARRYKHVDVDDLQRQVDDRQGIIATDGVFSMEGDIAPLRALAAIAQPRGLMLMVDEAHGLGVLGESGQGSAAMAGLGQEEVPLLMGTLGKALGTYGAFVAGSETVIESLIQFARSYVYTTAPPAAIACATLASLEIVQGEPERRERLFDNIRYFQELAGQLGIQAGNHQTPIQPVRFADIDTLMQAQQGLEAQGLLVSAIRPPTVPAPMLRITLSSEHQRQDIEQLFAALETALNDD